MPGDDARLGAGLQRQPAKLGAAAADIEDDSIGEVAAEQRHAAAKGQLGLLARGNDVKVDPRFVPHPRNEASAIGRPAACLSRDRPRQCHAPALHLGGADPQGIDGAIHRIRRQQPSLGHPLAQADDAGKGIDHLESDAVLPGNQQPAVIGTQIQRRHDLSRPGSARLIPRLGSGRGKLIKQTLSLLWPAQQAFEIRGKIHQFTAPTAGCRRALSYMEDQVR
jgi:hypothetical protein